MCKMGGIRIVLVVLSLCMVLKYVEGVGEYPSPPICEKEDCISYQVLHTQKEFEIRNYTKYIWIASGNITTLSYSLGRNGGYLETYLYYRGDNADEIAWDEFNRTQPVLTDVIPQTSIDSTYKVYLRVPEYYQNKKLPKPYDDSPLTFPTLPPKKLAAVTRFEGVPTDDSIAAGLAVFKNALKDTPWKAATELPYCTIADYDSIKEIILWFD